MADYANYNYNEEEDKSFFWRKIKFIYFLINVI